jgi:NAD(P)-dependent dehydrogenase (short-subunit alcohol dehydrogenase family)
VSGGRFNDKVAIVTGGGSGIGEATARRLAGEGAAVVVADLDADRARRVADDIAAAGDSAVAQACDVSKELDVVACTQRAIDEFGGLDIVHNNAADTSHATQSSDGPIAEADVEFFEHNFRVNVLGVVLGCKHAIPRLLERGGGAIINTSSMLARTARPHGGSAYSATKAAVESVTRSVAVQYGRRGIRCNGIAPGLTVTDHIRGSLSPEMFEVMGWAAEAPALATPEQQAAVVAFLASDDASYLNGLTIPVDAGQQLIATTNALLRFATAQGVIGGYGFGLDLDSK